MASIALEVGIIGAAASLLGVATGGFITWKIARDDRAAMGTASLGRSLSAYLVAIDAVAFELVRTPNTTRFERRLDSLPKGRMHDLGNRFVERVIVGRRFDEVRERLWSARADLQLAAPIEILALLSEVDDFMAEWQRDGNSDERHKGWIELRGRVGLRVRSMVEGNAGRPYRAGDRKLSS